MKIHHMLGKVPDMVKVEMLTNEKFVPSSCLPLSVAEITHLCRFDLCTVGYNCMQDEGIHFINNINFNIAIQAGAHTQTHMQYINKKNTHLLELSLQTFSPVLIWLLSPLLLPVHLASLSHTMWAVYLVASNQHFPQLDRPAATN